MRKTNKRNSKKRSLVFHVLYYWTKLVCINPLTLTDNNELRFSYYSTIYAIFLAVSYPFVSYNIVIARLKLLMPGETPIAIIVTIITLCAELLEATIAWFIFGFHQNRIKLIAKSFMKVEATSARLSIRYDYEKRFTRLAIYLVVISTAFVGWMIFNNASSIFEQKPFHIYLWICYLVPSTITFNRWTIIIWILGVVKEKFQRLNDEVYFLMKIDSTKVEIDSRVSSRSRMDSSPGRILLDEKIRLIAQLHRELRGLIYRIVDHIGACLLLDIVSEFLNITVSAHIAYRFLKDRRLIKLEDVVYLIAVGLWFFIPIGMLNLLSNACGSTAEEANRTGKILHAILNDVPNFGEIREAAKFNMLSLDLLQNHMKISVFGFFQLDYYFVYKSLTTVITLLTIMLQFYN